MRMRTNQADTAVVSEYLGWLSDTRGHSRATCESYRSTLEAWLNWLSMTGLRLDDATPQDVESWLQRPRQKRGRGGTGSPATRKREIASLRGFYAWGTARGRLSTSPMLDVVAPSQPRRQPRPITDKVWLSAWESDMPNGLRTAIGLGYFCGLRRAEIVSLTVDQLTDRRIVNFVRKGGGEDVLPWRTLVEVYETHLPHLGAERFVEAMTRSRRIGTHLTPYYDGEAMARAIRSQGWDWTPHQLRHSCATNLIRAGVPLPITSRMMNHTSVTTTMLYVKAGGDELRDWLKAGP